MYGHRFSVYCMLIHKVWDVYIALLFNIVVHWTKHLVVFLDCAIRENVLSFCVKSDSTQSYSYIFDYIIRHNMAFAFIYCMLIHKIR